MRRAQVAEGNEAKAEPKAAGFCVFFVLLTKKLGF